MDLLLQASTAELLSRVAAVSCEDESRESDELWALVHELRRRGDVEIFRAAVGWSTAEAPALRCLSADLLGQLGHEQSYPFATESAPTLAKLMGDADPGVIACALIAFGHLRLGDTAFIADLASHPDARVRHAVAVCLGPREEETATRTLTLLSRDDDRDVRDWATFGLGSMSVADSPAVHEALTARLGDSDHEVRGEAMVGLARRKVRQVIPAVLAELRGTASVLAIEAAGELADPIFVPELEQLLLANPGDGGISAALEQCRGLTPGFR